jgi:16S rRNA processing protein RimM
MRPDADAEPAGLPAAETGETLVPLGRVVRAHGIDGQVRVKRYHPASSLMREQRVLQLRTERGVQACEVKQARVSGDADLLAIVGIETREAAEVLKGAEVCLPRSAFPRAADDEVYLVDLIGLDVFSGEASLGRVLSVATHPSSDCLVIGDESGTREVPMIQPYLVSVDLRARRIELAHVEDFDLEKPRGPKVRKAPRPPKPARPPKAGP